MTNEEFQEKHREMVSAVYENRAEGMNYIIVSHTNEHGAGIGSVNLDPEQRLDVMDIILVHEGRPRIKARNIQIGIFESAMGVVLGFAIGIFLVQAWKLL